MYYPLKVWDRFKESPALVPSSPPSELSSKGPRTDLVYLSTFDIVNTSTDSVPEFVAGTHVINQLAGIIGRGYLEFINTDHTARDMVSIVKAHGRDKLYYWGFS